jgi:hypothetical protein
VQDKFYGDVKNQSAAGDFASSAKTNISPIKLIDYCYYLIFLKI